MRIFSPCENDSLIRWGYSEHDELCPIFPGNIILVAGYTGTKKSAYLHHVVNYNIQYGHRVAYCCLKDKPFDVGLEIIADNSHVNAEYLKRGMVTEEDWNRLTKSSVACNSENLALIPYDKISNSNNILSIIENSGAEIVVIDDLNGIILNGSDSFEHFLYQLKNIAARSEVVVFAIYNICIPKSRIDMRPTLRDFPADYYYRLFDVIQLLYKPDLFYCSDYDKEKIEVIIAKGALKNPYTIELIAPDNITGVFELYANKK